MELKQHLAPKLKSLRLSGILDTFDVRMRQAIDEKWTYADFLERLLEDEVERRQQKQLSLRVRRADLASDKTLETFDFTFNPSVNRQQLYDLATGNYIREHRNVLLCGPTGVGKSHLAQALAHEGCRRGFDVVFTNAHKMLRHLSAARADNSYEKRLALYVRPDLLVIDDFGLKPLTPASSEDLYDIIDERYERKGAILLMRNNVSPQPRPKRMGDVVRQSLTRLGGLGSSGAQRPCDRHHWAELPRAWATPTRGGALDPDHAKLTIRNISILIPRFIHQRVFFTGTFWPSTDGTF